MQFGPLTARQRFALAVRLLAAAAALLPVDSVIARAAQDTSPDSSVAQDVDRESDGTGQKSETRRRIEPKLPFRQRPYRVDVSISFSGGGRGETTDPQKFFNRIRQCVERMYGQMWEVNFRENDWLRPGTAAQLARIDRAHLTDLTDPEEPIFRFPEKQLDKAMLVCIEANAAHFAVSCREYDTRTQELSPFRTATAPDARTVPLLTARLIRDAFRPCLQYVRSFVSDSGEKFVELEVQAGEIPPPDPSAEQITEGDVLRPFLRFMYRRDPSKLKQLQPLPLTYVHVTAVDRTVIRGLTTGVLLSHAPVSRFGRHSRHLEHFALRQRPSEEASRVRLVQRSREQQPLVCHRVSLVYKLRSSDQDQAEQQRLLSDRDGEIFVPVHDEYSTLWLYVYSGQLLLARIPYAPGLLPADVVELPDDSIRLGVEGEIQLLTNDLIDSVAIREIHFSLARRAAAQGRSGDVEQHLANYQATRGRAEFSESLSLIRVAAVQVAQNQNNPRAELAVRRLCRKTLESLDQFFSEASREERLQEMDELRQQVGLP